MLTRRDGSKLTYDSTSACRSLASYLKILYFTLTRKSAAYIIYKIYVHLVTTPKAGSLNASKIICTSFVSAVTHWSKVPSFQQSNVITLTHTPSGGMAERSTLLPLKCEALAIFPADKWLLGIKI